MGKLNEYQTLEQKEKCFEEGNKCINTREEFDKYWKKILYYEENRNYKFRGMSEAKYQLYTSSQRLWLQHDLDVQKSSYHDFIKTLINNCRNWNQETIFRFFNLNGINTNNALAYLSYMQHFGVPTPLLDFTHSPLIGLYFALEGTQSRYSDRLIDQYCSLYMIDTNNIYFTYAEKMFGNAVKQDGNVEIDYNKHLLPFSIIPFSTENIMYKILNNINIVNQQGLFVFNNHPFDPIEYVYQNALEAASPFLENINNSQRYFGKCVNIHKSLKNYILKKLQTMQGINTSYIYPDNLSMKDYCILRTLEDV